MPSAVTDDLARLLMLPSSNQVLELRRPDPLTILSAAIASRYGIDVDRSRALLTRAAGRKGMTLDELMSMLDLFSADPNEPLASSSC